MHELSIGIALARKFALVRRLKVGTSSPFTTDSIDCDTLNKKSVELNVQQI